MVFHERKGSISQQTACILVEFSFVNSCLLFESNSFRPRVLLFVYNRAFACWEISEARYSLASLTSHGLCDHLEAWFSIETDVSFFCSLNEDLSHFG